MPNAFHYHWEECANMNVPYELFKLFTWRCCLLLAKHERAETAECNANKKIIGRVKARRNVNISSE